MTFEDQAVSQRSQWHTVTIGEVCSKPQYGWTTKATTEGGRVRLLRTTDITSGTIDWSRVPFCTEAPQDLDKYLVREGDIVISRAGSVGVSHLVTRIEPSVFASYLIRFRPGPEVAARYLAYFLKSPAYWRQIADSTSGIAIPNVNAAKLQDVRLPLAPLAEQRRIVAEIEKQFSRLDEAVADLQRVKANLRRYRAAALCDAVEGELAGERCAWKAVALGDVAASVRNGYSRKPDAEDGTPILRISAVRPLELNTDDVRYLSGAPCDYEPFTLAANDVLFTRYNGSRDYVGVCAQVPTGMRPTVYPDKLIRVRVPADVVLPGFLVIAASTGESRRFIESRIRTTAGQAGISGGDLKALPLRVPSLAEQHRIVAEVDRRLSIVREVEAEVDANLKRAQALRQSILSAAFAMRGRRETMMAL